MLTLQVDEATIWQPNVTSRVDGWFYLSNFFCNFLFLVIYEINFQRLPTLQMLVSPIPFNPCLFAGLLAYYKAEVKTNGVVSQGCLKYPMSLFLGSRNPEYFFNVRIPKIK